MKINDNEFNIKIDEEMKILDDHIDQEFAISPKI